MGLFCNCEPILDPEVVKDKTFIVLVVITFIVSAILTLMCLGYI